MDGLTQYFLWWRTTAVRDREIVDAVVAPAHRAPSPEFRAALARWPGATYWAEEDGAGRLVLVRPLRPPKRERWWLHAVLFLSTFITVWMGGILLSGSSVPLASPFATNLAGARQLVGHLVTDFLNVGPAVAFAMALMAILLAHETGHFIAARRYGINASPPYFLPAPPFVNFIGTFGAFIRLRSPIVDRRQLMDVGAAGPWAGFAVALVALGVGLARSAIVLEDGPTAQFVALGGFHLYLGDSPLMMLARELLADGGTVALHPLAFAGWLGLFVTMLNLLPMGQLDGGHVLYALIGRAQSVVGPLVWIGLIGLGFLPGQWWWWVWAIIILALGRGRLAHPHVLDRFRPLPPKRRVLGWASLVLFAATFTPVPIHYT